MLHKLATILVTFGYVPCILCSSEISASVFRRLQDPRQVDTWIVRSNPLLQGVSNHHDVFATHYSIVRYNDLRKDQQEHVMSIIYQTIDSQEIQTVRVSSEFSNVWSQEGAVQKTAEYMKANPEYKWTGQWTNRYIQFTRPDLPTMAAIAERSSIWKQGTMSNYLISCRQTADSTETFFVIGSWKKVLWTAVMDERDEPPEPSEKFPFLINYKLVDNVDAICELHANYKATLQENRRLIASNHDLEAQIDSVRSVHTELSSNNQELSNELDSITLERNGLTATNQRLTQQIETLNGEIARCRHNVSATEHNHKVAMDGMIHPNEHCSSILKWCCIVGSGAVFITVLVTVFMFKCCASNREKQSDREGMSDLLKVHVGDRKVNSILGPHRRAKVEVQEGLQENRDHREILKESAGGSRAGRPFSDLMLNSVAVQDVLMEDVMEEMEVEGAGGTVTGDGEAAGTDAEY